ncbi:CDP-diacylglycerol--glycerol-3-phosphate 3-phosphatidyltransferase [Rodentibacter pneumotropicus]|uniref:CDP-diacylglycerol--glycerol-3-phosphate 3-phosphatidyltransferase n=1 Tax=Rodentibacter pneumotropicus TaxID=758 RepID=A0A448MRJ4_9PAST|nr:CDP-diacylglycerol--glycerol-3-phosphate 3-phosphatidyltransferase [Rodentibacter pneumotropicus]
MITFYLPIESAPFITTLIFFIAGVTDWLDGYLARKWKQTSRFGAFLDPVADKVMVVAALVLIVEHQHSFGSQSGNYYDFPRNYHFCLA